MRVLVLLLLAAGLAVICAQEVDDAGTCNPPAENHRVTQELIAFIYCVFVGAQT